MKNNRVSKIVYAALFATLVFIGAQFIRIPLPFGYFNFGDCFILLSALMLGGSYAVIASAVGAGLADVFSGYIIYAPATILIKALMVLVVILITKCGKSKGRVFRLSLFAVSAVIAEGLMAGGYFLYDTIIYSFAGAAAALPGNIAQGIAAVVIGVLIMTVFEQSDLLKRIRS